MGRRLSLVLDEEASAMFDRMLVEANAGFEAGRITAADLLSEIITNARIDIRNLQLKHSDLRRSLKALSNREEIDVETAIKILTEMKGKVARKRPANASDGGAS